MTAWTDQFVGDRMAVDREFTERVAASEFSSQEWGTIMTAVEFEIEDPESPEQARVVADTSKVDQVLPAIESMREGMGMGGAPGAGGGGTNADGREGGAGSGSGLFGSIKDSLGLGGGGDEADHRAESAAALAEEYAQRFQEHLEEHGKWTRACEVAAATGDASRGEHAEESGGGVGSADEQPE
ncbi:hypothetical protein L593_00750 [Salinarchaeum sp. Harcht-Bsk1]|uniref:DUF5799 family protein n=1 Tax=Salinarchaeum sp. Harcht-Bsk1 TaxID=1333523 RepID=UPI0003422B5C|nr:DUF5799 family protein [Salinarchaeum sp. Harcht-Bsk1]AGN00105.1 hypothetical protein L593_00750 [Salinarchaeum sp. Harcht-Bsk1]